MPGMGCAGWQEAYGLSTRCKLQFRHFKRQGQSAKAELHVGTTHPGGVPHRHLEGPGQRDTVEKLAHAGEK